MAHPDSPPHLVYLHVGEEEETRGEQRLAAQLGIADRTHFLGRRHPLQALHAADVFVMPSVYEGLGIAAVEALATGLPVVLADVPGLRDMARISPAALLTDTTPQDLLAAIVGAAGSTKRSSWASPHVAALRAQFGMARGVAHYARLYHQLAGSRVVRAARSSACG